VTQRRTFLRLTLGMLCVPLAAQAQQTGKMYRIGLLSPGSPPPAAHDGINWGAVQHRRRPTQLSATEILRA
jgi:hypothetical protein